MSEPGNLINEIHSYVLANLDAKVSTERLAEHVGLSKFHLHRVFFMETGFDLAEYIVRRKMEHALTLMQRGAPGIEVALSLGYESHSSFSRAFRHTYGVSPSQANVSELQHAIIQRLKKHKEPASPIAFDREYRDESLIYGTYVKNVEMSTLSQTASRIFQELQKNSVELSASAPVGVSLSNPWCDDESRFFFGYLSTSDIDKGHVASLVWPAQQYATTVYTGSHDKMWQFISRCHSDIIRNKHLTLTDRVIYQRYLNSPSDTPAERLMTQLYFPVAN